MSEVVTSSRRGLGVAGARTTVFRAWVGVGGVGVGVVLVR